MEVQEGLASPFQQKLGFTQMLRIFRVDTSNAYSVYPFQFLRVKGLSYSTLKVAATYIVVIGYTSTINISYCIDTEKYYHKSVTVC